MAHLNGGPSARLGNAPQLPPQAMGTGPRLMPANHGGGTSRDTNQPILFISNTDVPHEGCSAFMQGRGRGRYRAIALGSNVIGVNLDSHGTLGFLIDVKPRTDTCA